MIRTEFLASLDHVAGTQPKAADLELLLGATEDDELALLFDTARKIRDIEMGKRVLLRGLVEFSSHCSNTCHYCGLNCTNSKLERYRLSDRGILESIRLISTANIKTVVLQSGEDKVPASHLAGIIREIKSRYDMAITVSVGERPFQDYEMWKKAGADRYLLRIESSDKALYESLHRGRTIETRLRCLDDLRTLGYQVGSGIMIGFRGQNVAHIARDILFFRERNFDMIGIGPFIPHPDTLFRDDPAGTAELTLKTVALTRIVTKNAWMPATTALGSMDRDYRVDALKAGANIVMPNFTPAVFKKQYEIYPGKRCISEHTGACAGCMQHLANLAGLTLDLSRGDSLKM
ncbi:MAG: [FeFe] hydrogenase H-cluster radical SAM maturase HydE [Spirochaetales bacterium]